MSGPQQVFGQCVRWKVRYLYIGRGGQIVEDRELFDYGKDQLSLYAPSIALGAPFSLPSGAHIRAYHDKKVPPTPVVTLSIISRVVCPNGRV